MAKKTKIVIHRDDDDLKSIDDELDEAIGRLDGANDKISSLLQALDQNQKIEIPDNIVEDWYDETNAARAARDDAEEE